uniref:MADS-box domain-containing protein n=1 Tax=Leersia perrieri TaxID=77586 RepID=A0A0D9V9F3_9ORYZ
MAQPVGYNSVQYMGVGMNGYQMQMQMPSNDINSHGQLQCWDNNNFSQIQPAPATNAGWHNFGAWDNGGEPCNAIVPSADPYMDDIGGNYVDTTTVSDYQTNTDMSDYQITTSTSTSDNFMVMEAPVQFLTMGSDELLQCSDSTQNSPPLEQLHYLSDVDELLQCNDPTQNSPIPIAPIADRRTRSVRYTKRKEGMMKKARELATLCGVQVAVVCAGPNGGAPDVWTTPPKNEGDVSVIDKYLALPAEKRAKHTHADYLRALLGKKKADLAKLQQDGPDELKPPKTVLDRMSQGELQQMLVSIDATLQATAERREALELMAAVAGDSGGDRRNADVPWPVSHGVPCTGTSSPGVHGYHAQVHATCNPFQQEYTAGVTMTQPGVYNNVQYMGRHCLDMNGYDLQMQMQSNGVNSHGQLVWGDFQPCNAAIAQPAYGQLQCLDNNGGGGYQIQSAPATNGVWHHPGAWDNGGEPCNAMVPSADPYMDDIGGNYVDTTTMPDYQTTSSTSDNFMEAPVQFLTTGSDETQFSTDELLQCSDSTQNSPALEQLHYLSDVDELLQCSDSTQNSPPLEQLHYLSDVDELLQRNDTTQNSPVLDQLHFFSDMADGFDFGFESNFDFDEPLDLGWEMED